MNTKNQSLIACGKVLAVAAGCLAFQSAQATLLFSEAFNYDTGALQYQENPSTAVWTGGNSGLTIVSGNLTYAGLADQGGNELSIANASAGSSIIQFANQTGGTIFYSFLFDPTTIDGGNDYFTALNAGTTTPKGAGTDVIDAYSYATSGDIEMEGYNKPGNANGGALTIGTTYLIVEAFDLDTGVGSLWVDPTSLGGSAPTATATQTGFATGESVDNVGFKTQSTTGDYLVDNLLIGTTWADVTPEAVPEPSTLALAGLGLLGLAARFRRVRG